MSLSTLKHDYDRDGFVVVPDAIDQALLAEARAHIDWLQARHPDTRPERLGHTLVADDPFWIRLVADPGLLDIAELFVGSDIALFASHYISKPPGDGLPVLWHQDGSYWPLAPMDVVTLWLAVDDSTPENGCMRVVPGTQHMDLQQLHPSRASENVLGSQMDDAMVDESAAEDVIVPAGGVSVHHPNVVHGSNANTSDRRRFGLTIRYIPTSTRITTQPWPCSFLLRGEAVPGVNEYLARPRWDAARHLPFRGCQSD
jgi:ectoine hydroxylase-related dioxygenase (phytanoyl-CoA dioxygenase family)